MNNKNIKVTIFCLTYNHQKYIRQALDSFLKQETEYIYNVFVYDDASTDGTSDILREYKEKYPDIFDVYISPKNIYNLPEREKIMHELYQKHIIGDYVAWCEGDDYWTDSHKLQIQVDFLEKNSEYVMTGHGSTWIDDYGKVIKEFSPYESSREISPSEIILQPNGNISTASLVMKKKVFLFDDNYPKCDVRDVPMQLYAICIGKIYYFKKNMSAYRYMHTGSWSLCIVENRKISLTHVLNFVVFLKKYNEYTRQQYKEELWDKIKSYLYNAVYTLLDCEKNGIEIINAIGSNTFGEIGKEVLRVFYCMAGKEFYDNIDLENEKKSDDYIVVYGAGKYSKYISKLLQYKGIKSCGNIVSFKDINHTNAYTIDQIPFDKKRTIVIMGISQMKENEINKVFYPVEYKKVIYPLWFDKSKILKGI